MAEVDKTPYERIYDIPMDGFRTDRYAIKIRRTPIDLELARIVVVNITDFGRSKESEHWLSGDGTVLSYMGVTLNSGSQLGLDLEDLFPSLTDKAWIQLGLLRSRSIANFVEEQYRESLTRTDVASSQVANE